MIYIGRGGNTMMYWFLGAGFWWGITLVLVALSVGKSLRWAKTGWLIGLSFLLGAGLLGAGWWQSRPTAPAASQQFTTSKSAQRGSYQLVKHDQVAGDDDLTFQTDEQGTYQLQIKGLRKATVQVKDGDDESAVRFKTQRLTVQPGKVTRLTIKLPADEATHEFELVDQLGHDTDFQLVRPTQHDATATWESK